MGTRCDPATRSAVTVVRTLVEQNHFVGITVSGSDMTVESSVVRRTLPRAADQQRGRGINLQLSCLDVAEGPHCDASARTSASVLGSLIEDNHDIGLYMAGSDVFVDASVIRSTKPNAQRTHGHGIIAQPSCLGAGAASTCDPDTPTYATIARSLIADNPEFGVVAVDSEATIDASVVRNTAANNGLFGDGIAVLSRTGFGGTTLNNVVIADSARAGASAFGAHQSISGTRIQCASFALNGEPYEGSQPQIVDQGGNSCGCPVADGACKLVSAGLAPPTPVASTSSP